MDPEQINNKTLEDFSNEIIDTLNLPLYEDVALTPLHPSYLKIVWINIALFFSIVAILAGVGFYYIDELQDFRIGITIGYIAVLLITIAVQAISFKNKGFAFREHDLIYRSGAIAITTTIIPYNRVQHAAQHEGLLSRWLGLAEVEVFTAGGSGSDIRIPGIEKEHAQTIKQLLIGRIQKQQADE